MVAYGADGKKAAEKTVKTAGEPARIVLKADRKNLAAKNSAL